MKVSHSSSFYPPRISINRADIEQFSVINTNDQRASNLTFASARLEIKVATVSLNARAANEALGSNRGKH